MNFNLAAKLLVIHRSRIQATCRPRPNQQKRIIFFTKTTNSTKFRWHNWNQFNSHNHKRWKLMLEHKTMFYCRVKWERRGFGEIPDLLFVTRVCLFSHHNWMSFLFSFQDFFPLNFSTFMRFFSSIWCIIISHQIKFESEHEIKRFCFKHNRDSLKFFLWRGLNWDSLHCIK